jgi:hypothetical protein
VRPSGAPQCAPACLPAGAGLPSQLVILTYVLAPPSALSCIPSSASYALRAHLERNCFTCEVWRWRGSTLLHLSEMLALSSNRDAVGREARRRDGVASCQDAAASSTQDALSSATFCPPLPSSSARGRSAGDVAPRCASPDTPWRARIAAFSRQLSGCGCFIKPHHKRSFAESRLRPLASIRLRRFRFHVRLQARICRCRGRFRAHSHASGRTHARRTLTASRCTAERLARSCVLQNAVLIDATFL